MNAKMERTPPGRPRNGLAGEIRRESRRKGQVIRRTSTENHFLPGNEGDETAVRLDTARRAIGAGPRGTMADFHPTEHHDEEAGNYRVHSVAGGRNVQHYEDRALPQGGSVLKSRFTVLTIQNGGWTGVVGALKIARDISRERQTVPRIRQGVSLAS